jgi:hypothetical protein
MSVYHKIIIKNADTAWSSFSVLPDRITIYDAREVLRDCK